jgi:hypothetical protein
MRPVKAAFTLAHSTRGDNGFACLIRTYVHQPYVLEPEDGTPNGTLMTFTRHEASRTVAEARVHAVALMVDAGRESPAGHSMYRCHRNEWSTRRMVKLTERYKTDAATDLPDHDFTMESGGMGDCVTMFVLWDWGTPAKAESDSSSSADESDVDDDAADMTWPDTYYRKVRGFHGFGAFEHINLDSLFADVPDNFDTKVFVCFGSVSGSNDREIKRVEKAARNRWSATDWKMHSGPAFSVNRLGELSVVSQ